MDSTRLSGEVTSVRTGRSQMPLGPLSPWFTLTTSVYAVVTPVPGYPSVRLDDDVRV